MPNPFKAIRNILKKKSGGKTETPDPLNYPQLAIIWPDGTWNFGSGESERHRAAMDLNTQSVILDAWAMENFEDAERRAGRALNPGMFGTYPPPIPGGWLPSEKIIKALFVKNKWKTDYMHYMVGQLTHLKHIRP